MRGLFLKTRVSVRLPLVSTLVVTSELSGPGLVVGLAAAVAALALALSLAVELVVQPAAKAASITIVNTQIVLVTLLFLLIG
jgi:hypothetical protein